LDPKPRQLPSGRHGLPRDAVVAQQRRRMIDAVAAVLRRKGFVAMTVEDIAAQAGVSRRTFYEHFSDKTDCFLAAYHDAVERLVAEVSAAAAAAQGWEQTVRQALAATLRFFATHVDVAHLTVIDVLAAGPRALAARDEALRRLVTFAVAEDSLPAAEQPPPMLLLQVLAGAVSQTVYAEVLHGRAAQIEQLQPMLTYLLLVPMYGPAGAARRANLPDVPARG
jgi:AcrR family transcriptional regulator